MLVQDPKSPQVSAKEIATIIDTVVAEYFAEDGCTPYYINCGRCDYFAAEVIRRLGAGDVFWHDEMLDCTESEAIHWAHCFICYEGRYYDAECSGGVDEWRDLPVFVNHSWRGEWVFGAGFF